MPSLHWPWYSPLSTPFDLLRWCRHQVQPERGRSEMDSITIPQQYCSPCHSWFQQVSCWPPLLVCAFLLLQQSVVLHYHPVYIQITEPHWWNARLSDVSPYRSPSLLHQRTRLRRFRQSCLRIPAESGNSPLWRPTQRHTKGRTSVFFNTDGR